MASPWTNTTPIGTGLKLALGAAFVALGVWQYLTPAQDDAAGAGPISGWQFGGVARFHGSDDRIEVTLVRAPGNSDAIGTLDLAAACQTLIETPGELGGLPDLKDVDVPVRIIAVVTRQDGILTRRETRSSMFRIIGATCIAPGAGQGA